MIKNVSFGHSGNYTCEVTADTPSFSTATATAQMLVVGEFFCLFGVLLRLRVCVCTESWASGTLMLSTHNCSAKKTTNPFFWAVDSAVWEWSMAMLEKKSSSIVPLTKFYVLFFFFSSFHAELPESRPTLYTEYDRYEPGDVLRANCSSPPSRPQVELTLTINNMVVSAKFRFSCSTLSAYTDRKTS